MLQQVSNAMPESVVDVPVKQEFEEDEDSAVVEPHARGEMRPGSCRHARLLTHPNSNPSPGASASECECKCTFHRWQCSCRSSCTIVRPVPGQV